MAYSEPRVTPHLPFFPPLGSPLESEADQKEVVAAASRIAASREAAMLDALNRPPTKIQPELVLKEPALPDDFEGKAADLDQTIYERGIAVNRDKLLSLGRERFQQLLAADHAARALQHEIGIRTDLTSWQWVFVALGRAGALRQVPVPQRTTHDQVSGLNLELDDIRELDGFCDLWKVSNSQPQVVRAIHAFRQSFETALFGQSMLERLNADNRLQSKFLCGGSSHKVRLFCDWLPVMEPVHQVNLATHLHAVIFWLASETSALPNFVEVAREHFNVLMPSQAQVQFATAVFDGFLLGHSGWALWQFVGRATGTLPDEMLLTRWREELHRQFRNVEIFHRDLGRCFLKEVGNHYQLDAAAHRRFVGSKFVELRDTVSKVAALAVEETQPSAIVGRFQDQLLLEQKPERVIDAAIAAKLNAVFKG